MESGAVICPLYREWLPSNGEELRDFPLYFHYRNLLPETPEAELINDIYLPPKSLDLVRKDSDGARTVFAVLTLINVCRLPLCKNRPCLKGGGGL